MLILGVVVLAGIALVWPGTRQWAFDEGRAILAEAGVRTSSIGGDWTEMVLHDVEITDDAGTWATAREVVLSWSPLGLLGGTLNADRVEFRGARMLRAPVYQAAPDQIDEPFAWPDLPVDVTLGSLTGDLALDEAVIGEALSATLDGKATLTSGGGTAEVSITRNDGIAG